MTCVSELCANAIVHTASGRGGVFTVEVECPRDGLARIAVTDDGGASDLAAGPLDLMAEGGRGLAMVAACTRRWGFSEAYPGRTVWAEACGRPPYPRQAALTRRPPGGCRATGLPARPHSYRRQHGSARYPARASARGLGQVLRAVRRGALPGDRIGLLVLGAA